MPWGLTRFHESGQSHFVTFCCYHRRRLFTTDASRRIFESALERVRRSFRLQVYGYVVMPEHSPAAQRTATGCVQRWNCPTQAKGRLEWATRDKPGLEWARPAQRTATGYAGRRAEVVEAGSIAAFDWRSPTQAKTRLEWGTPAFLAEEVLRFQYSQLPAVCGEAALYPS
jgi:hypothetical protein